MSLIIKIDEIKTIELLGKVIAYIMNEKKTKGLNYSNSGITLEQITETFFKQKNFIQVEETDRHIITNFLFQWMNIFVQGIHLLLLMNG